MFFSAGWFSSDIKKRPDAFSLQGLTDNECLYIVRLN